MMAANVDEPVEFTAYDTRWPAWYAEHAAELYQALGERVRAVEHFGSTAVVGLAAKPIIDVLVGPLEWPLATRDRKLLEALGYEYLGQAGVTGREYFRRRRDHHANVAAVEWNGPLWRDNIAVREYLRCHPDVASRYACAKEQAWAAGARMLLDYSAAKGTHMSALIDAARKWRAG
jgi:GrpB-like predicted nucleotidyltransferase (UPF0157 family)